MPGGARTCHGDRARTSLPSEVPRVTRPPGRAVEEAPMTRTQRRSRLSTVAVSALAAALVAGGASSADAGPAFVEHWDDDFSLVHPDGDPDFCGDLGFDVVEHVRESGSFVGVNRGPD